MAREYKGKPWKVLKCPDCHKRFKSEYAKQYHVENAERMCPKFKIEEEADND